MATLTLDQRTAIIVNNPNKDLIQKARKKNKKLLLHTHGIGLEEAIKKEDYFENADIYKTRKDIALSNKDLMARTLQEEEQVFTTRGGSASYQLPKTESAAMDELLSNVRFQISLRKWVREFALNAYRSDPMGLIFMEVEELFETDGVEIPTPKCYPTYKSTQGIFDYESNGRNLEYVVFQLNAKQLLDFGIEDKDWSPMSNNQIVLPKDKITPYFRFIDDSEDVIYKLDNNRLILAANTKQKNPVKNKWGKVPAFIVSDLIQFDEPECFGSPLQFVVELCDSFLTDRSVRDLQKKYHGFAKAVEPLLKCPTCAGTGQTKGSPCPDCTVPGSDKGTGYKLRTKVSEVSKFPLELMTEIPRFDFKNIFGYVTPDIESWRQQDATLDQLEQLIYYTYWGTARANQVSGVQLPGKTGDKTAFEVNSNLKPKYARLNQVADWAENAENMIADFIGQFWFSETYKGSSIAYGRSYILETPGDLIQAYYDMRENGANEALLDEAMERYLKCLFQSSPVDLTKWTKLFYLEPARNISLADAFELIQEQKYNEKMCFSDWYCDLQPIFIIDTPIAALRKQLTVFTNAQNIPPRPVPQTGQPDEEQNDESITKKNQAKTNLKTQPVT